MVLGSLRRMRRIGRRRKRRRAPAAGAFAAVLVVGCAVFAIVAGGSRRAEAERVEWVTMGTVAAFMFRDGADAAKAQTVRETFAEIERLLNAHDGASELSRLASMPDAEILERCAPLVRPCYEAAFRFRDITRGAFNPRWRGEGTMDLGGIAKGFALDVAAARVGECDALIDLGGNLKACGGSWKVGIHGSPRTLTLTAGMASSTSGEYFRGRHIKDGRTGADVSNGLYSVTVVDPASAMTADALSTAVFVMGGGKGEAFAAERFPDATVIVAGRQ